MSVAECQARVSSEEFTFWKAKFMLDAEEMKAAAKAAKKPD